jgi:cytoskeleton protein RodZ
MSEEQDNNPVEEQSEAEPQGPRGGERLAVARREQQISVLEVAKELHLDEPKVRALERNDFEVLGAPVFAKGHLRKYAQLVGVDEDDVFADYYQMTRQEPIPPVVIGKSRARQELSPGPWIAAIIVILVAAASYWWFALESETAVAPETTPEEALQPEQIGNDQAAGEEMVVLAAAMPNEEPTSNQVAAVPDENQPLPEPVETLADGQARLSLSFSGDCWTEISDATGRRLFFDMGRSGRSVELTGTAPFAALFGDVDNVDVTVNGSAFPISTTNPGSRTARLTIMNP